jgi:hypothetical protein
MDEARTNLAHVERILVLVSVVVHGHGVAVADRVHGRPRARAARVPVCRGQGNVATQLMAFGGFSVSNYKLLNNNPCSPQKPRNNGWQRHTNGPSIELALYCNAYLRKRGGPVCQGCSNWPCC